MAVATLLLIGLTACDDPDGDADPTPPSTPTSSGEPSSDPSEVADVTGSPSPSVSGDPDLDCLVAGSTWHVSTGDLESQYQHQLSGLDIIDVSITGGQTLTMSADGTASFTPNRRTVVRVDLGDGLVMTMTQRHTGSSTGRWQVADGRLTSPAPWDGDLAVHTTVAINGRSANQTVNLPVAGLDGVDAAFSCAPRELMIQAEGSPFSYLFH